MTTKNYKPHIFALSVLFTIGNTIILLPDLNLLSVILLPGVSMILLMISVATKNIMCKKRSLNLVVNAMVGVVAVYGVVTSFLDYLQFLKKQQSPQTATWLIAAILAVTIIYFVLCKNLAIYKFSLFAFFVVAAIISLVFISGIKNFDLDNARRICNLNLSNTNAYLRLFAPIFALPFFFREENCKKTICIGGVSGVLVLLGVMFQTLLTFGAQISTPLVYINAVSVISVGSLFTRLDGLVWFVFFATSITRCMICAKIAVNSVKLSFVDIYKRKPL